MTGADPRPCTVVGAGPAGLSVAILLRLANWNVTILDRLTVQRPGTRAPTLWPPAMNVMDLVGVGDSVRERSCEVSRLRFTSHGSDHVVDLKSFSCRTMPQGELENLLGNKAQELGVQIIRGFAVDNIRFEDGTAVAVSGSDDQERPRAYEADLIVGADGAHSKIREILDLRSDGAEYETRFALVDLVDYGPQFDRDEVATYSGPSGTLVTVPLPDDGMRIVAPVIGAASGTDDSMSYLEDVAGAYGYDIAGHGCTWRADFNVAVKMAESFGLSNVALIGDAAHVQSPAGGRGMNNGIEDAMTLATEIVTLPAGARERIDRGVQRYSSIRMREMADELGVVRTTTDRWVEDRSASPQGGATGALAGGDQLPERSEMHKAACVHDRARKSSREGSEMWERPTFVGMRLQLSSIDSSLGRWPALTLLTIGMDISETEPLILDDFSSGHTNEASCVGVPGSLPSGLYALTPGFIIVGFWSARSIRMQDQKAVAHEILDCMRKNELKS